jgi:hypothetical protein
MKKYNVIWFDDEHDDLPIIREKAALSEICLVGFKSAAEGIRELRDNINDYDAAILDGNFFLNENQHSKADDKAFGEVAKTILSLTERKKLPWFILSGQFNFTRERNKFADVFNGNKVYDKLNNEQLTSLWSDLRNEANRNADTQLRVEHWKVFEACTDKYIGKIAARNLLFILKKENVIAAFKDSDVYFNSIRKIMEDFFNACNRIGILPDTFVTGSIPLNECERFFNGKEEKGYVLKDNKFIGEIISRSISHLVRTSNSASHRSDVDKHIERFKTPYLLMSQVYQLLDVLIWFKEFADASPSMSQNNSVYQKVDDGSRAETGPISQDSNNNYYCGDFLLGYQAVKGSYAVGDRIRIVKWEENSNVTTKDRYPKFARRFEKA